MKIGFLGQSPKGPLAPASKVAEQCVAELGQYFRGERRSFGVKVAQPGTGFQQKVWAALREIPFGTTIAYAELAHRIGDIKAVRAVGTANGKNHVPIIVPCHRVIGKDGSLTGFSGGLDRKAWLLRHEGVLGGEQLGMF